MVKFMAMEEYVDILNFLREAEARYNELSELICSPEIIAHTSYLRRLTEESADLAAAAKLSAKINSLIKELEEFEADLRSATDNEYRDMLSKEIPYLRQDIEQELQMAYILKLRVDESKREMRGDAYIQIFAESKDNELANDIIKMYKNYAASCGFTFKAIDATTKYRGFNVGGGLAYSKLICENGIHKSDKGNVRVVVLPKLSTPKIDIRDRDIRIDLFHSGGAGGQNVNKVQTAVRATHLPSGISVVCQNSRSQLQNKNDALESLRERVTVFVSNQNAIEFAAIKTDQLRLSKRDKVRTYNYAMQTATNANGESRQLKKIFEGDLRL